MLADHELIELCLLVGHYEMLAMTLNSLQVERDRVAARQADARDATRAIARQPPPAEPWLSSPASAS